MKHIFLSYTKLCSLLINKTIDEYILKDSYFLFGCKKVHVFRNIENDLGEFEWFEKNIEEIKRVDSIIKNAVIEAEKDNRIVWRDDDNFFEKVAKMLGNNLLEKELEYHYEMNHFYLGTYILEKCIKEFTNVKCM